MSKRFVHFLTVATFATLGTLAACGGDKTKAPPVPPAEQPVLSAEEYRAQQQHFADSIMNATRTAKEVVDKLGKDYFVGSVRLRDTLAVLTEKSNCYFQGRQTDPYLAGTASWFVFMSVIGSNVVRIQESQWTSAAGNIVTSCLNLAAKNWTFDPSFGKPGAYITQVQMMPERVKAMEKAAEKKK